MIFLFNALYGSKKEPFNSFLLPIVILGCLLLTACQSVNYYNLPTYSASNHLQAVIEIPAGTNHKIEYDSASNQFINDTKNGKPRVVQYLPYLGNYGFIPSTMMDTARGGDGDALDILVLGESQPTGTVMEVHLLGALSILDGGEIDTKLIAIPADPSQRIIHVADFQEFSEKYPLVKEMIKNWFLHYKRNDQVSFQQWMNREEAMEEVKKWR